MALAFVPNLLFVVGLLCDGNSLYARTVVHIDFDARQGSIPRSVKGNGILHSLTASEPPAALFDPLNVKLWRGAKFLDDGLFRRLSRNHAAIQYVLSDPFEDHFKNSCDGNACWPQHDYARWQKFVKDDAKRVLARGWDVIWEPWNEPDFWSGADAANSDAFGQYLEAFKIAYETIRRLDPNARFSGPSLSAYSGFGWKASRGKIERFLAYCAKNHIEVADLSWHAFDDASMHLYPERLQEIRALAAKKYPSVKVQRILISELVSEAYFYSPGDYLATLIYLDRGGADLVARACWGYEHCWEPTLDAAAIKDKEGVWHKTPSWWAGYWFENRGEDSLLGVSDNPGIAAIANLGKSRSSVVVGFSEAAGPKKDVDIEISLNVSVGKNLKVFGLPKGHGALDEVPNVGDFILKEANYHSTITIKKAKPGESYRLEWSK